MDAAVQYYPLVRWQEFGSVDELCAAVPAFDREVIDAHVASAGIEGSELVICGSVIIGDPEDNTCAVLQMHEDRQVTLWLGLFNMASEHPAQAEARAEVAGAVFEKPVTVAEVRTRNAGHA